MRPAANDRFVMYALGICGQRSSAALLCMRVWRMRPAVIHRFVTYALFRVSSPSLSFGSRQQRRSVAESSAVILSAM
eukprot:6797313-Lingulodinium_polyedra.AAC.1